jgi:phosphatidylglycerol:prolipoprotein diacylglycerol transferase
MHPELGRIGPFVLRTYTVLIDLGLLIGLAILAWRGRQVEGRAVKWLDVGLAGIAGGLVGARALHVVLSWDYFQDNSGEILQVWTGGLSEHGALVGGLAAGYLAARLLRVPLGPLTDALAVAFPIGAALAWAGCLMANCAYGQEVRTLADFPPLVAAELPDIYGTVAPRYSTQLFGAGWSLLALGVAALLTWRGVWTGARFWPTLAFYSLGALLIAELRGDAVPMVAGARIDQVFDLVVIAGCVVAWLLVSVRPSRAASSKRRG